MKKLFTIVLISSLFVACNKAPELSFNMNRTTAHVGEVVSFENTTEKGKNFVWDFGDGSQSEAFDATHVYTQPGTYIVSLSASSRYQNKFETESKIITITGSDNFEVSEDSLVTILRGEWELEEYEESTTGCGTSSLVSGDYSSTEVSILNDGLMIIDDEIKNKFTGSYGVLDVDYISINLGTHEVNTTGGTTTRQISGNFNILTLDENNLLLERKEYQESFDINLNPCTIVTTFKIEMRR